MIFTHPSSLLQRESVSAIKLQLEDNAVWQSRIQRLASETAALSDEIASLEAELADVQFSNQSLKSELCGRCVCMLLWLCYCTRTCM